MSTHYTYLLINFFTVIICFVFSFDKRIRFDRYFGAFLKAVVVVSIPFVAWDVWFAQTGVWWFNDVYTLGYGCCGCHWKNGCFYLHPFCLCFYLLLPR